MVFGLATIGVYFYLVSVFDNLTIGDAKNYIVILPIIFILAWVELFAEIKWGFKKIIPATFKGIRALYRKIKLKILNRQIAKGKKPSDRNLEWLAKQKKGA